MKRIIIFMEVILFFCFLTGMAAVNNYSPEVNAVYEQLKSELQKKNVDIQQITDSINPIKDLLAQGVNKEDVKRFILDLCNKKLDPASFKSSLASVSELTKDGEAFKKAKDFIAKSVQQAQAQGLKGDELNNKIQAAFKQEQDKLEDLKKEAYEKGQRLKDEAVRNIDDVQNKTLRELLSGQKGR